MKACPYCAEEIQDAAIVCKHCGRATTDQAVRPPAAVEHEQSERKSTRTGLLIILFAVIGFGVLLVAVQSNRHSAPSRAAFTPDAPTTPIAAPSPNALALLSLRCVESSSGSYYYVQGQIKNVSGASIKNVAAVGTWFDKSGTFIKSDSAIVEYNPLLPGQTSPFKTISSGNPEMNKCRADFKTLGGGLLGVDDQTK